MREAVIVSACRTAIGKAPKGSLRNARPDDMIAQCMTAALARVKGIDASAIEDIVLGCAYPEAQQGRNLARMAALVAGWPVEVAGVTVNRLCASGLEAVALATRKIEAGEADVIMAGGVESMSQIPRGGHAPSPNPALAASYPDAYLSMGLTAERVAAEHAVSREAQDAFALDSHAKAAAAQDSGRFAEEIVPLVVSEESFERDVLVRRETTINRDEGIRRDTTAAALAGLKPAFAVGGSVTAGNSSQTSDGAAAVLVMSMEAAKRLGATPLARLISYRVSGCAPEVMGIGPVAAIPKALKAAGKSLAEIDLIELNEAFAAQAVAVVNALDLPNDRLNVNGGAVALGHPLGATGARLTVSLIHELARRRGRHGLVSMCVGGGMGAAAVFERLD